METIETYTVQFRSVTNPRVITFSVLANAIAYGIKDKEPFDISNNNGAIVWVWEQH